MPTTPSTTAPESPTAGIDRAIAYAADDLKAARNAALLRPSEHSEADVQAYQDALDGLLEARKGYR